MDHKQVIIDLVDALLEIDGEFWYQLDAANKTSRQKLRNAVECIYRSGKVRGISVDDFKDDPHGFEARQKKAFLDEILGEPSETFLSSWRAAPYTPTPPPEDLMPARGY